MSPEQRSPEELLREVVSAIERGRSELFQLMESLREEQQSLAQRVEEIRQEVRVQIELVDSLTEQEKLTRQRLLDVSSRLREHTEEQIRAAYEEANRVRMELRLAREREAMLRRQRDDLERRLRALAQTVRRAEEMMNHISVAYDLLSGRIQELTALAGGSQRRAQLVYSIIRAQEEERRRLAREIHDGPAQVLANVVFRLDICQRLLASDLEKARAEIENLKALVRQSLQEVRKIIFDLRPMALEDLGLIPALRAYLESFGQKTGLATSIRIEGQGERLPLSYEVALFRLVQEALNNVAKHAAARTVKVLVQHLPEAVRVVVVDDGKGFDVGEAMARQGRDHFGLLGMRERVELLGGALELSSRPGEGTKVSFTVPCKKES